MPVWVQISSGSDKPIYAQIVDQVSQAIAKGELVPGDKLPAVRKLASELVINPNTVASAYRLLERAGLVVTKSGSGTFINDPKFRTKDASDINFLAERMDTIISKGLNLGLKAGEMADMFKNRLSSFIKKSSGRNKDG